MSGFDFVLIIGCAALFALAILGALVSFSGKAAPLDLAEDEVAPSAKEKDGCTCLDGGDCTRNCLCDGDRDCSRCCNPTPSAGDTRAG